MMMTTMTTDRAPRRRHAAGASRILVGGISVATTLGLTAHWGAAADRVEITDVGASAQSAPAPAQRIVILRRIIREVPVPSTNGTANGSAPAAAAPAGAPPAAAAPVPPAAAPAAPAAPAASAAVPALPSAALAPPPVISAPAPASSSAGS